MNQKELKQIKLGYLNALRNLDTLKESLDDIPKLLDYIDELEDKINELREDV